MQAIIYTGETGAGHTLAAKSLEKALSKDNNDVKIIDAFKEGGNFINTMVTKGYQRLVENLPFLYRFLYKEFDSKSKSTELFLKETSRLINKNILNNIAEENPDIVISTHPIVTNFLGRLKKQGKIDVPILAFITDFKIHDMYLNDTIDAYVVSSEYTKQSMVDRGIPAEKIFAYGIPVREEFREEHEEHQIDPNKLKVLLMAGSLGFKQLKNAFKALEKSNNPLKITVVCGKNEHVKKSIEKLADESDLSNKEVEILGFTDQIPKLMNESDLLISKPGGLTSSEAISMHIPLIIPYTYPGQEEDNAKYLENCGMAINLENIDELTTIVDEIFTQPEKIKSMSEAMSNTAKNYSIEDTVKLCESLAK